MAYTEHDEKCYVIVGLTCEFHSFYVSDMISVAASLYIYMKEEFRSYCYKR